ncbi:MAG: tetratricopeptide repeat protein [Pseudomonadota bacterium]
MSGSLQDIFGQQTTLSSPAALQSWNATMMAFLAHSAETPNHLASVLNTEPDFALGHAVKGLFYVLLGRRELYATAIAALEDAKRNTVGNSACPREQNFIHALTSWIDGNPYQSVAAVERVLTGQPRDALAAKLSHALRFVLGDSAGMRTSLEAIRPHYDQDHPAYGYLLGCYSFALEETGDFAEAERTGKTGLEIAADDAWGLHSVAHVYDMTGRSRDGLSWLDGREAAWEHCNNFRYHVWWHKALMHLDLGQIDVVFDLYDRQIRQDKTDDYRDISNATSLLTRLELNGFTVGQRWEELAELCEKRTEDGCLIFADLHYLLALLGGDRKQAVSDLIGNMNQCAVAGGKPFEQIASHPGLAAANGLEAFGEGNYEIAFLHLANARQSMQTIGGSHAQRDVFERLTIDAGIRGGYLNEAEMILSDRTERRNNCNDGYSTVRFDMIRQARLAGQNQTLFAAE